MLLACMVRSSLHLIGVSLGALTFAAPTHADETEGCAGFCWSAPAGCPTRSDILARVVALCGSQPTSALSEYSGRVSREGQQWLVRLTHGAEQRVIQASSCVDVSEAAAMVVALAITPENDSQETSALIPVMAPSRESEAEQAGVLDESQPPKAMTTEKSAAMPDAQSHGPTDDVDQAWFTDEPSDADSPANFTVSAAGIWDAWLLPESTLGVRVGASLLVLRELSVSVHGSFLNPIEQSVSDAGPGVQARYDYAAGGAYACWQPKSVEPASGCLGAEVGRVGAEAAGLANGSAQVSVFPAVTSELKITPRWGRFTLDAGLEGVFPLLRDTFTVDQLKELHSTPPWTLRAVAGLTFALF